MSHSSLVPRSQLRKEVLTSGASRLATEFSLLLGVSTASDFTSTLSVTHCLGSSASATQLTPTPPASSSQLGWTVLPS